MIDDRFDGIGQDDDRREGLGETPPVYEMDALPGHILLSGQFAQLLTSQDLDQYLTGVGSQSDDDRREGLGEGYPCILEAIPGAIVLTPIAVSLTSTEGQQQQPAPSFGGGGWFRKIMKLPRPTRPAAPAVVSDDEEIMAIIGIFLQLEGDDEWQHSKAA